MAGVNFSGSTTNYPRQLNVNLAFMGSVFAEYRIIKLLGVGTEIVYKYDTSIPSLKHFGIMAGVRIHFTNKIK